MNIPFLSFDLMLADVRADSLKAFERVLDSKWYVLGEEVKAFEAQYAAFCGTQYSVGLASGLDALILALRVLEVGPGDEVIVPSNTYIATVLAASAVGATPVLVEPDGYYLLDPGNTAAAITPRTKAIMPVHLYGQACRMDAIMALAERHGLSVVEDNAQAHGATWNGKTTGSFGQVNAHSFYPGKNLGALGDGGAATTDNSAHDERLRLLRNYGSKVKYHNQEKGYNSRLDEVQAAQLSVRLARLMEWTAQRQQVAARYDQMLAGLGDLALPAVCPGATHVYHLYVVRTERRDQLAAYLRERGIGTLIHYPIPPHLQPAYAELGLMEGAFPIAEHYAKTCLSLPMYPGLSESEQSQVAETIAAFFA